MKKTFRFLSLGLMLLGGTLSSFATVTRPSAGPADDAKVGSTVSGGVVVYKVTGWDGNAKNGAGKEVGAYTLEITGLDYTGIQTKPTELNILTAFQEKYGEIMANYYVTKISDASITNKVAFYAKTDLTSLTFTNDESVVAGQTFDIGTYAFYGCTNLATLTFPDNVKSIGAYAFQNSGITNFEIPAKCSTIGENAFNNCQKLNEVKVRSGVNADGQLTGGALTVLDGKVFANSTLKTLDLSNAFNLTTIGSTTAGSPFLYKLSDINNQLQKVILPHEPVYDGKTTTIKSYKKSAVSNVYNSFKNCTALTSIENLETTVITAFEKDAFQNCQNLPELNFPVGVAGTALLQADASNAPFKDCPKLATLTFADGFVGTIGDGTYNLYGTAAADLAALQTITFKGVSCPIIKANAFGSATAAKACSKLETVEFKGAITVAAAAAATIEGTAFQNCAALKTLSMSGMTIAATGTAAITIAANAFTSTALETVSLGNITGAATSAGGSFLIGSGGTAFSSNALTTFTVGNINTVANNAVTFGDGTNPVAAKASGATDVLSTVTFGNISTDATVTIAASAFTSNALANVTIGDLAFKTSGVTTGAVTINANAFTNGIGTAFDYSAKIGKIGLALTTVAGSFTAPAVGNATFEVGDVDYTATTVVVGSFVGSKDAAGKNNTTVKVGAYNNAFAISSPVFTNAKDVTIDSWNVTSNIYPWAGLETLTITKDVTGVLNGDNATASVKSLTIGGNVEKAGGIGPFGALLRTVTFSGNDPVIAKDAFAASSLKKASDAAKIATPEETITITYKCATEANYNPIFVTNSLGDDNLFQNVVLYTTEWAKNNIFENDQVYSAPINRLSIVASAKPADLDPSALPAAKKLVAAKNGQYQYGRLYVPQAAGMLLKVDAKVSGSKNGVNIFAGHLDGDNIYMKQVDTYDGYYWIDATEAAQVFIVRTSDMEATEIATEQATADEIADTENVFWYAKSDAKKNCLKYATAKVVNQELQNNAEFKNKTIYVMANPATQNLAFAKLDQYATTRDLGAGSIYVISKTDPQASAARLNVIFEDDAEATAINKVENKVAEDDVIYNLQGVRVNKAGKGIYIINGKKVIR